MRVMIVHNKPYEQSETFVRAHVDLLPGEVSLVHGFPACVDGQPVLSPWPPLYYARRAWQVLGPRLFGFADEVQASYGAAIRQKAPDVVLAEYGMTGARLAPVCARLGVPLVVHFHGHDAVRRSVLDRFEMQYREMFGTVAGVVAVSRAMVTQLESLGAPPERLHVNACGVDCDQFSGANPKDAPPVFLAVGRFVEKKAPHLTVLAFREALRHAPEARLRMIGDGPLLSVCKDLASALGIADSVHFAGRQPHEVIQQEMRAARAFVQHSIVASDGDSEGTPVAILEAGATGLPVIATRHAGIPDVVEDGQSGLLVEERNVQAMADYIRQLALDPARAGELGARAAQHIRAHHTIEQSIGRLASVLESSLPPKT